jgi:hypothetical protein
VPNTQVSDDQARRAQMVAGRGRAVVSACETLEETVKAVARVLAISASSQPHDVVDLNGAEHAADEILALIGDEAAA